MFIILAAEYRNILHMQVFIGQFCITTASLWKLYSLFCFSCIGQNRYFLHDCNQSLEKANTGFSLFPRNKEYQGILSFKQELEFECRLIAILQSTSHTYLVCKISEYIAVHCHLNVDSFKAVSPLNKWIISKLTSRIFSFMND